MLEFKSLGRLSFKSGRGSYIYEVDCKPDDYQPRTGDAVMIDGMTFEVLGTERMQQAMIGGKPSKTLHILT